MTDFKPETFEVALTPATIGQFQEGDGYGQRGTVISVSLTKLEVCISKKEENCAVCKEICPFSPTRRIEG